jgi:hypothetical protein
MNDDTRYKAVLFKLSPALLERLDIYADEYCNGNRSLAIRRGILLLLLEEQDEENELLPVNSHIGNRGGSYGQK